MKIDIVSLFPDMFAAYLDESILKRAQAAGHITITPRALRPFGLGKHAVTDEPPNGGGGGMVLRPEPLFAAVEGPSCPRPRPRGPPTPRVILMTPQGRPFTQAVAQDPRRRRPPGAALRPL